MDSLKKQIFLFKNFIDEEKNINIDHLKYDPKKKSLNNERAINC